MQLGPGETTVSGTTVGGGDHATNGCTGEANTDDRVYSVTPTVSGFLTATLHRGDASYDSILYALGNCLQPTSNIICHDQYTNTSPNGGGVISFECVAGQPYTIVVDGWNGQTGTYTLTLDLSQGTCADPVPFTLYTGFSSSAIGNTVGEGNEAQSSVCGGGLSNDVVYEVTPGDPLGSIALSVEASLVAGDTSYDAVLHARSSCNDLASELDCDRDTNPNNDEVINYNVMSVGPTFVWVDGVVASEGEYRLRFEP